MRSLTVRGGGLLQDAEPRLAVYESSILACLCLGAGVATLVGRWIADDLLKVVYGVLLASLVLGVALLARATPSLQRFSDLAMAFFVLAVVQALNNSIPGYVGTVILHDAPTPGNPLASTLSGTLILQLLETLLAIAPIVVLTRAAGWHLAVIYARPGVIGRWLLVAVAVFGVCYVMTVRPGGVLQRVLPTNGELSMARIAALTPALLVMVLSNGFEEEFLFRGLFLRKYTVFFGPVVANVLQALIFTAAHVGITYTPTALLFLALAVFPLGLLAGYVMRSSNGILAPAIMHAGLDIPIYLVFLSYAT